MEGILVPQITPFAADGSLALGALEDLVHHVLDEGAAGIVALGTTAETATLDAAERRQVIDVCAKVCQERDALLLVGAGGNNTRASQAALAELPDIAGALVPVPSYSRPGERGVVEHFRQLAKDSPVPLVVYHIPYRTAQPLSSAALLEIAALPGVRGMKLATGAVDQQAVDLLGNCPPDFAVLAGDDVYLSPLLAMGARGGIIATANLAPRRFADLYAAWQQGDLAKARSLGTSWRAWPRPRSLNPIPLSSKEFCTHKAASRRPTYGCRSCPRATKRFRPYSTYTPTRAQAPRVSAP